MRAACGLLRWRLYFALLRLALLIEDPRDIGSSLQTVRAAVPGLERWLGHVFKVMGSFMVATGALTVLALVIGLQSVSEECSQPWRWPVRSASG